jgi:F0F1-type ATP synthase membrane subunit b/b'
MEDQGNNIISQIIEIDEDANAKLDEAQKKYIAIIAAAKQEKELVVSAKQKEITEKLEAVEADEEAKLKTKTDEINKSRDDELARLDAIYNEKSAGWTDEIVKNITQS